MIAERGRLVCVSVKPAYCDRQIYVGQDVPWCHSRRCRFRSHHQSAQPGSARAISTCRPMRICESAPAVFRASSSRVRACVVKVYVGRPSYVRWLRRQANGRKKKWRCERGRERIPAKKAAATTLLRLGPVRVLCKLFPEFRLAVTSPTIHALTLNSSLTACVIPLPTHSHFSFSSHM